MPGPQIINYATHQFRLMPLLALTYAMHFGGVQTTKIYLDCSERLEVRMSEPRTQEPLLSRLTAHFPLFAFFFAPERRAERRHEGPA